jgi:hypothetical protein
MHALFLLRQQCVVDNTCKPEECVNHPFFVNKNEHVKAVYTICVLSYIINRYLAEKRKALFLFPKSKKPSCTALYQEAL